MYYQTISDKGPTAGNHEKNNNVYKCLEATSRLFKMPLNLVHELLTDPLKCSRFNRISSSSFKFHVNQLFMCLHNKSILTFLPRNRYDIEIIYHIFQYAYIESCSNWISPSIRGQIHAETVMSNHQHNQVPPRIWYRHSRNCHDISIVATIHHNTHWTKIPWDLHPTPSCLNPFDTEIDETQLA